MSQPQLNPKLALEMTMRDVFGNLEDFASGYGYQACEGVFEILAIETPQHDYADAKGYRARRMRPLFDNQAPPIPLKRRVA